MLFSQPLFIYISLILVPVMIVLVFWLTWQRRRDYQALGNPAMVSRMLAGFPKARRGIKALLLMSGLLLMALALAGPQYGSKMVEVHRQGVEIVIALDVSKSMLAEDIKPDRLDRAKQELQALIDQLQGDRVGVVAFAGQAVMACPLTTDYDAAKMFLSYLRPEQIPVPGTNISDAIQTAVTMYGQGTEGYRVLVLLTDGEDHSHRLMQATEAAKKAGIKLLCIGFGSTSGEPIPIKNDQGAVVGYVKDDHGKTVVSRLDQATLKKITAITKGVYLPAQQGQLEADVLAEKIDQMQKRAISSGQYGASEDRFQFLLLPALLLLLLGFWVPLKKHSWLLLLLLVWGAPSQLMAGTAEKVNQGNHAYRQGHFDKALNRYRDAQMASPDNSIVNYNLGNALQQKKDYEEADKSYHKSLQGKDKKIQAKVHYNLGNNYFAQKKYAEAVEQYKQTLRLDPKDEDALYNLAQTLLVMKHPEMQKKQDDKQKKQKHSGQSSKHQARRAQAKQQDKQKDKGKNSQKAQQASKGPDDKGRQQAGKQARDQDKQQEAPPLPKPGEMSREDAKNLLDSIREAEQQAQARRQKKQGQQVRQKGQPDW